GSSGVADIAVVVTGGAAVSPRAFEYTGPYFSDLHYRPRLNPNLEDSDGAFSIDRFRLVNRSGGRHYLRTRLTDYSTRDFSLTTHVEPLGTGKVYVGLGSGEHDPVTNCPRNSVGLRIDAGTLAVDYFVCNAGSVTFTSLGTLSNRNLRELVIRKIGDRLDGGMAALSSSFAVPSLSAAAPFLDASSSRLFMTTESPSETFQGINVSPGP
ncbi:MAG: hypothetical protein ACAI25_08145, partial [Planctomycetota bacterium]